MATVVVSGVEKKKRNGSNRALKSETIKRKKPLEYEVKNLTSLCGINRKLITWDIKMKKTQSELMENQGLVKKEYSYSEDEQIVVSNYLKRSRKVPVKFKNVRNAKTPKIKVTGKDELLRSAKVGSFSSQVGNPVLLKSSLPVIR